MDASTDYNFTVSYSSEVSQGVHQAALALRGYRLEQAGSFLSYTAALAAVNSTAATIAFRPLGSRTTVAVVQFELLVTSLEASGKLELLTESI